MKDLEVKQQIEQRKLAINQAIKRKMLESKGITMVSLVVTIIVLLIITSISIGAITAKNNTIDTAISAKEETEIMGEKQIISRSASTASAKNKNGMITKENLEKALANNAGPKKTKVDEYGEGTKFFVTFLDSQRIYQIDETGAAKYVGKETNVNNVAVINVSPSAGRSEKEEWQVDATIKTFVPVSADDEHVSYAWSTSKSTEPTNYTDVNMNNATSENENERKITISTNDGNEGLTDGDYYLWIKVKIGEDGEETKEVYGPYTVGEEQHNTNSWKLEINPNGGRYNNTTEVTTITKQVNETVALGTLEHVTGYTVSYDTSGGNVIGPQTTSKTFKEWKITQGAGRLSGTTYIFGNGNGVVTAMWNEGSITLPTPTGIDHRFMGWYKDEAYTQKAGNAGDTFTPTSNITLYAKWNTEKYTVAYYNGNIKLKETEFTKDEPKNLDSIESLNGTQDGYTFSGWTKNQNKTSKDYSDEEEVLNVTEGNQVSLYAVWQRDVTFKSGENNANTQTGIETYNPTGNKHTVEAPTPVDIEGWTTLGWRNDNKAEGSSYSSGSLIDDGSASYNAVYSRDAHFYSGENKAKDQKVSQYYNSSGKYGVKAPEPQAINGWKAEGWRKDGTAGEAQYHTGDTIEDESNRYNAVYSREVTFNTGNGHTETETQYYNTEGTYSVVAPTPAEIEGWEAIGWRNDEDADEEQFGLTDSITDPSEEFNAVYRRTLTIKYNKNAENATGTMQDSTGIQYHNANGATSEVSFTLRANGYTRTGYAFKKWLDGETQYNAGAILKWNPGKTASSTKTLNAMWESTETTYTVKHYVHDLGANTYTLNSTENKTGTPNSELTLANLKKTIAGFTYEEGYLTGNTTKPTSGAVTTTTIAPDGSRVINLYYRRNYLYIQYDMNGGSLAETHGTNIGTEGTLIKFTNIQSTKFLSGVYGSIVGGCNASTYAVDIEGLGNWNSPDNINIEKTGYMAKSGEQWNTKSDGTGTSYNQVANTNYQANGFAGADLSTGDKTVTLYVNWTTVNYTITYNLDGGTNSSSNPANYTIESNAITLQAPTKTGFTFKGWTGSNGATPQTSVTIATGSTGNKTYTANWIANNYAEYNGNTLVNNFETLAEALSGATSGNTIKPLKNTTETTAPSVPSGKTLKLDLNGKTITLNNYTMTNNGTLDIYNSSSTEGIIRSSATRTIVNNGTLTTNNTSNANKLSIINTATVPTYYIILNNSGKTTTLNTNTYLTYTNAIVQPETASARYLVYNAGTLRVTGATLTNTISSSSWDYGISNAASGRIVMTSGTLTTYGASIYSAGTGTTTPAVEISGTTTGTVISSNNNYTIKNYSTGTITINGGSISSNTYYALYNQLTGTINVTGGVISSTSGSAVYSSDAGTINVTNGIIKANDSSKSAINMESGSLNITGGKVQAEGSTAIYSTSTGKITIGEQGSNSITSPEIIGRIHGNSDTVGEIIVHSGKITGTTSNGIYSKGNITINGGKISSSEGYAIYSNSATSKIKITGGEIETTDAITVSTTAEVGGIIEITGGTITRKAGENGAILNNLGTTTITGGTITSTGIGVRATSGTVTIGTNENGTPNVSTTVPSITGTSYGVQVTEGELNFYDGVIKGEINHAISKDPTHTPTGYSVKKTTANGVETVTLTSIYKITYQGNGATNQSSNGLIAKYDALYRNTTTNKLEDMSGNGKDGTAINVTYGTDYLQFNGTSSWVNLGKINSPNITIEATISLDEIQYGGVVIISNRYMVDLWLSDGKPIFQVYIDGKGWYNDSGHAPKLEIGKKYHITGTYDGNAVKTFIDGNLVSQQAVTGEIGEPSGYKLIMGIGAEIENDDTVKSYFKGKIYNAAVYNKGLTADQVAQDYGKEVTYGGTYGTLPIPERTGYSFQGWYTEQNGGGSRITAETGVTITANQTLYAKWGNKYTIKFNSNGGTGTMSDQQMTYGTAANLTQNAFTRQGYSFDGWRYYTKDFEYTGNVQEFTAPADGTYILETWGAQGGSLQVYEPATNTAGYYYSARNGGKGGYSSGKIQLHQGDKLYIVVGGAGGEKCGSVDQAYTTAFNSGANGGYNGGGKGGDAIAVGNHRCTGSAGGGGATHIATSNRGTLSNYSSNRNEVLLVAAGGGGAGWNTDGGYGGGTSGGNASYSSNISTGATQSTGYQFGLGQNGSNGIGGGGNAEGTGGGGGGYYGGNSHTESNTSTTNQSIGGAGGSGYVSNSLSNASTSAGNGTILSPFGNNETGHSGNGFARISLVADTYQNQQQVNNLTQEPNGIVNLYAIWKANTYTVSFNGNGGSNGTSITKAYGETLGNLPQSSRTNYYFDNWYTETNGGTQVTPGTTMPAGNTIYYAHWITNQANYTVNHYVHDLGTNTYTLNSTETKSGQKYTSITLENQKKTIAGFTYEAGYTTGNTTKPTSGAVTTTDILANGTRVINLYYRRNVLYLQYNMNGGSLSSSSNAALSASGSLVAWNGNTNVPMGFYGGKVGDINTTNYTTSTAGLWNYNGGWLNVVKDGYGCTSGQEWNTAANGSGTSYNHDSSTYDANGFAGADLSTGDKTITIYVNWKIVNYTISYTLNGGTNSSSNPTTYNINSSAITLVAPTRTGFTFAGWTGSNGSTAQTSVTIAAGSTGNKSYTANWTDNIKPSKPTYVAKYSSDNTTYTSGTLTNREVYTTISSTDAGSGITEIQYSKDNKTTWTKLNLAKSNGISQSGTTFSGSETWTVSNGRNDTIYFRTKDAAGNFSDPSDAFVIKYDTAAPTCTITSNATSDTTTSTSVTYTFTWSETLANNTFTTADITVTNGTKGTFSTVTANKVYTLVVANSKPCTQTVSIAANACQDAVGNNNTATTKNVTVNRTITFNANGGSGTMTAQTITASNKTLKANTFTAPTGQYFGGWATSSSGSIEYANQATLTDVQLSTNLTLYAKWKDAVLLAGSSFNTEIKGGSSTYTTEDNTIKSITFGKISNYTTQISGQTAIPVDENRAGLINAYKVGDATNGYDVYVLSDYAIYANLNSSYMFARMLNITSLNLNELNTSKVTNMSCMFSSCGYTAMTSLNLGDKFDTSNVTDMYNMFSNCGYTAMTSLNLGNKFYTSKVTNMNSMFNGCGYTAMTSLNLGNNFDTSNVQYMQYMFQQCGYTAMTMLNLGSAFDTSKVTNMDAMFDRCGYTVMSNLNLGNKFYTSKVTNMRYMFSYCGYTVMTSLNLGNNFDTSSVINMNSMFFQCGYTAMTSLNLGDKFDTSNVTNMEYMFYSCGYTAMTSLDLGDKFDTSNVTNMNSMFYSCGYTAMTSLDLGDKFDTSNVTTNMNSMFYSCGFTAMTSLDLGDKFDTSNVTSMSNMFGCCGLTVMTRLDLGDKFDTSSVQNMSYMFNNCGKRAMTVLDLGDKFNTSNVTNMTSMFSNCDVLTTIYSNDFTLKSGLTSTGMFTACNNLVGGAGTTYNSSYTNDATLARVDGGASKKGYFTAKIEFSRGQIVKYGGEEFYSLNDVGAQDTTMEIFAKTNLNQAATLQANAGYGSTECVFSSEKYWSSVWTSGNALNLNNVTGYTDTDVMGRVNTYARTKGAISGRLLTYDEANTYKNSYSNMIYGKGNTTQNYERYWLGSARETIDYYVYMVKGESNLLISDDYSYTNKCGVRPVLTVNKSDVTSDEENNLPDNITKIFSQGQLVRYNGEQYYSLYDVSSVATTMQIFAKTNLNQAATLQANASFDQTKCTFSSESYWEDLYQSGKDLNLNLVSGEKNTDVIGKAKNYARIKNAISARLLIRNEYNSLVYKSTNNTMIGGMENSNQAYEKYWIASTAMAWNTVSVNWIDGQNIASEHASLIGIQAAGCRPILTVYVSQVSSQ